MFNKHRKEPEVIPAFQQTDGERHLETPAPDRCVEYLDGLLSTGRPRGAVAKLYLENFKLINDTFGHDFGEQMLEHIYTFLEELEGVQPLRYGGVEFLLVMDRFDFSAATETLSYICERFEQTWRIGNMDYMCAMSLGAVFYPDRAETAAEALKALEYAVTQASQTAQNSYALYDSELDKKVARRKSIARQLLQFERSPEMLELRFRPTYSLEKQCFTRAECYFRLLTPDFGPVQAAEFIPIAEDSGMICALNASIIERVCAVISRLCGTGVEFESIAVPISPVQFLQEQFVDDMQSLMSRYGIPKGKLAFEVTESVLVNAFGLVNVTMQYLSGLGIELVLNEFGTGYSGINNILDLPIDVVKLERLFIWQLETNPKSGFLIEGLIRIADNLGLKLIAEGVETQNQLDLLTQFGCRYAQGFYYSPTVDAAGLETLLRDPAAVPDSKCSD